MIVSLLVILAVFAAVEFFVLRSKRVVTPQVRITWDGRLLTPPQTRARVLLRDVCWVWLYGYLPPRPYKAWQKLLTAARAALGFAVAILLAVWLLGCASSGQRTQRTPISDWRVVSGAEIERAASGGSLGAVLMRLRPQFLTGPRALRSIFIGSFCYSLSEAGSIVATDVRSARWLDASETTIYHGTKCPGPTLEVTLK